MIQHCKACTIEIVAGDIVVSCEGLCEDQCYYHARCVGLSYDEGCSCLHENIFWMCDSCRDAIQHARFRKAFIKKEDNNYDAKREINCLKSEVKRISEALSVIETISAVPAVPNQSTSSEHQHSFINKPNSPLSSTRLSAINSAERVTANTNLQLYVSNIAPDVTEHELKQMICESLGAVEVLHAKCLISSWQDISTFSYVSYKITVDNQFRDAALTASNWPKGVRCREFRDFINPAWRPSTRMIRDSS